MADTFRICETTTGLEWSIPRSDKVVVLSDHPYLKHIAAISIFNKTGSGKIARIKSVSINTLSVLDNKNSLLQVVFEFYRITAVTGGIAIPVVKLDQNNADLPSDLLILSSPNSVSITGSLLQRQASFPCLNETRPLGFLAAANGSHNKTFGTGQIYQHRDPTNQRQKIVLRSGEGFTIRTMTPNFGVTAELIFSLWIRNVASGACYLIYTREYSKANNIIAILNQNVTAVFEIFNIEIYEVGLDSPTLFSLEGIDGSDVETNGSEIIVCEMAPTEDSPILSKDIVCYKNAVVQTGGTNEGALIVIPERKRILGTSPGLGGQTINIPISIKQNYLFLSKHIDEDIVLREGKGIALMQRNGGKIGEQEIVIEFTQEDSCPVTPSTGYVFNIME